jgi:hypothetical protein
MRHSLRSGRQQRSDAFDRWRKVVCYLQRSGAVAFYKRKDIKRDRQRAKQEIRRAARDG